MSHLNGNTPKQATLKPEQVAVACAVQRLVQAAGIEIGQLQDVWDMKEASVPLIRFMKDLDTYGTKFITECQRTIIIPNIVVPSIAKG